MTEGSLAYRAEIGTAERCPEGCVRRDIPWGLTPGAQAEGGGQPVPRGLGEAALAANPGERSFPWRGDEKLCAGTTWGGKAQGPTLWLPRR